MPSRSKAQQRAAGMALAAKRGEVDASKLKGAALQMFRSMSEEQLAEYAATERQGLPEHVDERPGSTDEDAVAGKNKSKPLRRRS